MNFLWTMAKSCKTEAIIILGVIVLLFCMPIVAIVSAMDISVLDEHPIYTAPADGRDLYDYGNCTYWAALRRIQIGRQIPNTWGDAHTWDDRASRDGYRVDHIPEYGAIMESDAGVWGHVAFVESVDASGNWTISEMNVIGFDQLDTKTLPPASAAFFKFIH